MTFFIPPDNDKLRDQFEPRYGTCAPAAIATLKHTSVSHILDNWKPKYRGYAPIKEVKKVLSKDFKVEWIKGKKARKFPIPKTRAAIVRIGWLREDGTEYYFMGAPSHFVLLERIEGEWWIFCNKEHWFKAHGTFANDVYLRRGYITSYFEITEKKQRRL